MTTPLWCLLVACILPYVMAGVAASYKSQQFGSVDINEPRLQESQLTGAGGRASAAQSNAWEALAVFAPAVLANHMVTGGAGWAGTLAMVWVVARLLHGFGYVQGMATVRVAGFFIATVCSISLFVISA